MMDDSLTAAVGTIHRDGSCKPRTHLDGRLDGALEAVGVDDHPVVALVGLRKGAATEIGV